MPLKAKIATSRRIRGRRLGTQSPYAHNTIYVIQPLTPANTTVTGIGTEWDKKPHPKVSDDALGWDKY